MKEKETQKFHFIGIGGAGMSGIAQICLENGYHVSGSDLKSSEVTDRLRRNGALIHFPHSQTNISEEPIVVISSAIPETNEELSAARKLGLTIKKRAEVLGWFMKDKDGISIAGCHGKTTTTSMTSAILTEAGFEPSTVVGGEASHVGGNAKYGKGSFLVAEADESDGSFLCLPSRYCIVTNVDNDHLDFYHTVENIRKTFIKFVQNIGEMAVLCGEDAFLSQMKAFVPEQKVLLYGYSDQHDYQIKNVALKEFGSVFEVHHQGQLLLQVELNVPGLHNVLNATGAISLCHQLKASIPAMQKALFHFKGVQRRFELIQARGGIRVYDDYAHHPTEVLATLKAARNLANSTGGKLVACFQPHRFSRLKHLLGDFAQAFKDVDFLYLAPVYSAGEVNPTGLTIWDLYHRIQMDKNKVQVLSSSDYRAHANLIARELKEKDIFITLGAGDVTRLGRVMEL